MSTNPPPKIIIDDDWKTRVQAEKEAAQEAKPQAPELNANSPTPSDPTAAFPPIPPASFALLVTTFATEALAAMGHLAGHSEERPAVRLDLAKHFIDTLSILEEKTKGNLDREEKAMLDNVLHELRIAFVAAVAK